MSRYTVDLTGEIENKLKEYMKENKIKLRSVGIKNCIVDATNKENINIFLLELDKKFNKILYRQNMLKKLLEQLFVNMGFPVNEIVENDLVLKDFYDKNNKFIGRFD